LDDDQDVGLAYSMIVRMTEGRQICRAGESGIAR